MTVRVTVGKVGKTGSAHITVTGHASHFRVLARTAGPATAQASPTLQSWPSWRSSLPLLNSTEAKK